MPVLRAPYLDSSDQNIHLCAVIDREWLAPKTTRNGGYACGHAKTEVALRDELPVSLCPRLAGFALID